MASDEAQTQAGGTRVPNRWGEGSKLRQELLDAAQRLLVAGGNPDAVSLRAIAREAGVTPPAIYKHFADKSELMWALLDTVYASLAESLRSAAREALPRGEWDAVRAAVDAYCLLATDEPRRYELLFRVGPTLPPPRGRQQHPLQQVLEAWQEAVGPYLNSGPGTAQGGQQTAKLLWSGLHGQFGLWWNISDDSGDEELVQLRDSLLTALFGRS